MKIVIMIEGGLVQQVISDQEDLEILVVDADTEDCIQEELKILDDEEVIISSETPFVDPDRVTKVWNKYENF